MTTRRDASDIDKFGRQAVNFEKFRTKIVS